MSYQVSYNVAKARYYHFLLNELINLSNIVPNIRFKRGRLVEFPLPVLFVLLGLKFESGLSYRNFVASVDFNPYLLERLDLERAPSHAFLHAALKRIDTHHLHKMYQLLARKRPPPKNIAVDASGFSYPTGGEWVSVKFKRVRKRRFDGLHNAVDTDTLLIHATRLRGKPGGDPRFMVPLVRRVPKSNLETVYGDKAYISRRNVQFIADVGAYPAIEPKKNLTINSRGHRAYGQLIREYRPDPEEWKRVHRYGKRNLVETVFSVMKLRYGGNLSSRGWMERRRELLIKVVLHNIERLNYLECAGR